MKKKCEYCGTEYDAKRESSKYCSANCRVQFSRVSVTETLSVTEEDGVSVTNGDKLAEELSVTKNQVTELVDNTEVSVPERQLSVRYGDKAPKGFDDPYSPKYDLSESGYIRRNKNWGEFSERFTKNIREGAIKIKKDMRDELAMLRRMRAGDWVNPLDGSKLAPKT